MKLKTIVLAIATITTGLSAGLLFGYQVSVVPAFKTLPDADYIAAMQAINVAIQNPIFLLTFFGAAILLPISAYVYRSGSLRFQLLIAATLLYIIGTIGITIGANVPLNDTLAAFSLHSSTPTQAAIVRAAFEVPWNTWHLIRTYASVGALVLVTLACLSPGTRSTHSTRSTLPMHSIQANLNEKTTFTK